MSNQVLALKWRPESFESFVGQHHVIRALTNALDQHRLHHAYLFTGTRGVGKTTLGRILAKCLNCEKGISSKPCNQCPACIEIASGCFIDLIEVDAASRTKVEDTRELLENVPYAPTIGRFKVYLIDEAHMLSTHSFNALLKTLEEPPPHVKFFLATTDPQKLPITVLSRCLQFHLKCLTLEQISDRLAFILNQENIRYEQEALQRLAYAAQGSIRDALSLSDQAIAFTNNNLCAQDVKLMLGTIEATYIYQILEALAQKEAHKLIAITHDLAEKAIDFRSVLEELLSFLHQIAVAQFVCPIEVSAWDKEQVANYANTFSPEDIQLFYQIGLIGRKDLSLAPTPRIGLEMALLRMLAFQPGSFTNQTQQKNCTDLPPAQKKQQPPASTEHSHLKTWQEILSQLNLTGITAAIAQHCILEKLTENEIILTMDSSQAILLNKKQEERLSLALQTYFNRPVRLEIVCSENHLNTPTPALLEQQEQMKQKSATKEALENDLSVKKMIQLFAAKILPDSIEADS
jgi:DNA polymerase III subunit gamma/tau